MKKFRLTLVLVVPVVAILLFHNPAGVAADDFDLNACYSTCGCAQGTLYTCQECKAECERKYWKAFDREMDDMTGGSASSSRKARSQR